jgi:diguanylate cyclase (GGDEF)-like protein/PAS domain S-box-containing protein
MATTGAGFGGRLRARLSGHTQLLTLAVAPVLWLGSRAGMIAEISIWHLLAVLFGAQLVTVCAFALWPGAQTGWRLFTRVGAQMLVISATIYAIGWGPTIAIGLLVGVADNLRESGSRATFPAVFWSVLGIALGQVAIVTGITPSLVAEPIVHGLAVLAALGLTLTIVLLGWATAEKERAEQQVRASEERFRALVQHASDIIMVVGRDGELQYASPAFERVLGHRVADAMGADARQFMHPDDGGLIRQSMLALRDAKNVAARAEIRLRGHDGEWRWFDASVTNLLDDPEIGGIVANLRDIGERVRARRELMEAEERFRSAFEDAPIGMAMTDIDGRFLRVNRALGRLLGRAPDDLLGVSVADVTHPDDVEASRVELERLVAGEQSGYRLEKRYVHADGHEVWASLSVSLVRSADGEPLYTIGQMEDITERKAITERLAHAAIHDPLTGLPNRTLFVDRLALALDRSQRSLNPVGVIFLDLDRFKFVNDSLGHATGDDLLKVLAERLRAAMRPSDTVARFGGDEFVVLVEDVADANGVRAVAERVADAVARPVSVAMQEVFVTASLGVAVSGRNASSPDEILRDADTAMYRAKELGRARVELFEERSHLQAVDHLQTGRDLHHALERGEFEVHYQPIVELDTGRVSGFEALLRWNHPVRGLLLPGEFIGLAEETGLIVPIGLWVLEQACRQTVRWQANRPNGPPLSISVNLAPRQIAEPSLPKDLAAVLERTGIDARVVVLELTESALIDDEESASRTLHALRDQGVHIAVDDFGTGYSSLVHLKRFPVRALKIDQAFVDGLGQEPDDTSIVTAVVGLAHSLGLAAVAEGLETPQQLAALRTIGCDYAQGSLFGRPLPAASLGEHPADDLVAWQTATE